MNPQPEMLWSHPDCPLPSSPVSVPPGLRQPAVGHFPVRLEGEPDQEWLWRRVREPGQQHPGSAEPAAQQQGLQPSGVRCHPADTAGGHGDPEAR